jgi:CTP:molybdopterin cytidylyltransferase MocA
LFAVRGIFGDAYRRVAQVALGMQAVIPAAGHGSRLGELTAERPKGLVDIAGRPLLAHVFDRACDAGADALVAVIGYEEGSSSNGSVTPTRVYRSPTSTNGSV